MPAFPSAAFRVLYFLGFLSKPSLTYFAPMNFKTLLDLFGRSFRLTRFSNFCDFLRYTLTVLQNCISESCKRFGRWLWIQSCVKRLRKRNCAQLISFTRKNRQFTQDFFRGANFPKHRQVVGHQ